MHARPPPMNVILSPVHHSVKLSERIEAYTAHSQVRVNAGNFSLGDAFRERRQPALGLPLHRVLAPDCFGAVRGENADSNRCIFWDQDLVDHLAVDALDGFREGKNDILARPASGQHQCETKQR